MRRLEIDLEESTVRVDGDARAHGLGTPEAFAAISEAWLRTSWDTKHVYSFTWLGRPVIQLPEDLLRFQEVIYGVRPDVIVETGIAHGGSLVFYATVCRALGHGRVVGIDVDVRPHNRQAIEEHPLAPWITMIEGSSVDARVLAQVRATVGEAERVLVLLDSAHHREHVLAELRAYASLVTPGSYMIVMDGIMEKLVGAPRSAPDWASDNPRQAVLEFARESPDFVLEEPRFLFNEGVVEQRVTYSPDAFLRRR